VVAKQSTNEFVTSREAANLLGVSLRSVQLWVESGVLSAWKTAGGHRRIALSSVNKLLQQQFHAAGHSMGETHHIAGDSPATNLSVVVVEDEHVQMALYKIKFDEWALPLEVFTFMDAYQALLRLDAIKPALLITDLNMPGTDGFRMIHALNQNSELNNMQIVAVTALTVEEIAERGGLPKRVTVLKKPIPFEVLERVLRDRISTFSLASETNIAKLEAFK
jgi:excisionase family DNA binding protein